MCHVMCLYLVFFFFQAEDGIRDGHVTGVQTCALPISQIAIPLIMDGEMVKDNLAEADVTEEWLLDEISRQKFSDIKEVFYAEWLKDQKLFALPYRKIKSKHYRKKFK